MDFSALGPPSGFDLAAEGLFCLALYEFFRRRAERRRQRLAAEAEEEPVLLAFPVDDANPYLSPGVPNRTRRAA